MSKIKQKKIPIDFNKRKILVRQRDKLQKVGEIKFVEWDDEGNAKALHDKPKVGFSCIVDPSISFTWLTTPITDIISENEFKTQNSHYIIKNQ